MNISKLLFSFSALLFLASCGSVPISGRQQLVVVSEAEMLSSSREHYKQFLAENKLSSNKEQTAMIKRVGENISRAVMKYLQDNGQGNRLQYFEWEFNLVEDPQLNAWCMPGGKVVFYTGILPLTQTETGVAVIMGHEVAHAVAQHGAERMSSQMGLQLGDQLLSAALKNKTPKAQQTWRTVYGVGSNVGIMLPFSRKHEYEADNLGLIFMAMAGYNPTEAIGFWQRMSQAGGEKPPEIMSTHPADDNRVKELRKLLPKALKYYKKK